MGRKEWIAHTSEHGNESLLEHLHLTAFLAERYGNEFHSGKVCRTAALLHDIGKRTEKFQKVLKRECIGIDHSIVGAEFLHNNGIGFVKNKFIHLLLCGIIGGHHSSLIEKLDVIDLNSVYQLPDEEDFEDQDLFTINDKENALSSINEYEEICDFVKKNHLLESLKESDYEMIKNMSNIDKTLYARMIYSCLVDADYTATAAFMNQILKDEIDEDSVKLDPEELLKKLHIYRADLIKNSDKQNVINQLRNVVYEDATLAGTMSPGFYTMTAPTGTAKTLAIIKFALEQAKKHHKERIFIVLPYLSIISQNAAVYRDIFGDSVILEDDSDVRYTEQTKTLAERWDAPIIVTTSVKFFEAMFTSHAVNSRKLHRLSNAVVVFDECQTLPHELTDTTMQTLMSLTKFFNTTVLLSTATQPSYHHRQALENIWNVKEVILDVKELYQKYENAKNTKVKVILSKLDPEKLIMENRSYDQMLYVFNTTGKALEFYQKALLSYPNDYVYFLSSDLCNAHKKDVIRVVKERLENNLPCILVSTQCIEAGVDIDFPHGAREFAPLASIIQTAGRVNRNGRQEGAFLIFRHESDIYPDATYHLESIKSMELAEKYGTLYLNNLRMIDEYYASIYREDMTPGHDKKDLEEATKTLDMTKIERNYKLIKGQEQLTVIIPYKPYLADFVKLQESLVDKNYCIKKSDMNLYSHITVHRYSTMKNKAFIQDHCHQLNIMVGLQREIIPIPWYIADKDSIYDEITGLKKEETENFFMF